jgi:DNA-directed RNA polymerase alpha subunit
MAKKSTQPDGELPVKLSNPARRALAGAGYTSLDQLAKVSEADILKLHGMGKHGIVLLRQALAERGLSFAASPTQDKA